jgi:hypothetical protein
LKNLNIGFKWERLILRFRFPNGRGPAIFRVMKMRGRADTIDMRRRRIAYDIVIAGPFILLAYVAISARIGEPTFEQAAYSTTMQERLVAYSAVAQRLDSLGIMGSRRPSPEAVREAAAIWNEGIEDKRLLPLTVEHRRDSVREGIKGQARVAAQRLLSEIYHVADVELDSNPKAALADIESGFKISRSLKYSDLFAIGYFSMRERSYISLLARATSKFDSSDFAILDRILVLAESDRAAYESAIRRLDRVYWIHPKLGHSQKRLHFQKDLKELPPPGIVLAKSESAEDDDEWQTARVLEFAENSFKAQEKTLAKLKAELGKRRAELSRS